MRRTIYILGNQIVAKDSKPFILLPFLKGSFPNASFVHIDPTEDFPEQTGTLYLIDTIEGIKKITIISSLSAFEASPRFTVHDYDLLLELQLRKKLKKIADFVIIGVPMKSGVKEIKNELIRTVSTLLSKNVKRNSYKDHRP